MEDSETANADKPTFDASEREKHKKQRAVGNSLGALLSGLGSGGPKPSENSTSNPGTASGPSYVKTENQEPQNWIPPSQKADYDFSTQNDFGWSAASSSMGATSFDVGGSRDTSNGKPDNSKGTERKDPYEKDKRLDDIPNELSSWTETRILDEDYDSEWFAFENQKLAELYGEGIVTVKYTDQGGLSYYCELCYATMNAKKPLEMHCSGMKHLKKKDIYDKSKASGGNPLVERRKILESADKGSSYNEKHDGRFQEREKSRGRSPPGPSRSRQHRSRSPPGFGGDSYGRRRPYPNASDRDRDPYGQGRDRFDRGGRNDHYHDSYRGDYRRHPGDRRDDRFRADDQPRYGGEYRDRPSVMDRLSYSDQRRYNEDDAHRSRDYRINSPLGRDASDPYPPRNRFSSPYSGDHQARLPSPPRAQPPPPIISANPSPPVVGGSSLAESQNLSSGPAASLLSKLAQCTVKTESDATLASNVIDALLRSLREYNRNIGEKSVAELMEQAEIKLGTAKAIRKVSKTTAPLSVAADPISIAMETLRRAAAAEKNEGSSVFKYF